MDNSKGFTEDERVSFRFEFPGGFHGCSGRARIIRVYLLNLLYPLGN
jgi:hypothetical protein